MVSWPQLGCERHPQGRPRARQFRVGVVVAGGWRNHLVVHGQGGLDQPGDSGGRLGVTDVALDGADGGRVGLRAGLPACLAQRAQFGLVADGGAGAVPFQVADRADVEASDLVGPLDGEPVPVRFRPGEPAPAVRGVAPPSDRRVAAQTLGVRVRLAQQHEHAAPLARPEPVGVLVVYPHVAGRQGTGLGEPDHLERVDAQVHATGDDRVDLMGNERVAGHGDAEQRGRARTVHGEAAALEVELVGDAAGDRVGKTPGQAVLVDRRERALVPPFEVTQELREIAVAPAVLSQRGADHAPDIRPTQPHQVRSSELPGQGVADDDGRAPPWQPVATGEPGVDERPGGGVERQPVGQVGGSVGASSDLEMHPVEVEALDHGGVAAIEPVGCGRVRRPVVRQAHALVGYLPEGATPGEHVDPQLVGISGVGIPARHSYDGDCLGHEATACSPTRASARPMAPTAVAACRCGRLLMKLATHQPSPRTAQTIARA